MIASAYIKNGHICFYNENRDFINIGGIEYELGKPLLNFLCYEHDRFKEGFSGMAEAFDDEFAHLGAKDPAFRAELKLIMTEMQKDEIYIYFYGQMLMDFIFTFLDSPRKAVKKLTDKLPEAKDKLAWTVDFTWPASSSAFIEVRYADKEKRLYKAAMDVIALMFDDFKQAQEATKNEIELLLILKAKAKVSGTSPMEYLYLLEMLHKEHSGDFFFLEKPFRSFYGVSKPPEIVELYEIDTIKDLLRFEFVKMIEHDIFIKKCKNCGHFFIPRRRADTEYCHRLFGETGRKCSEIGATLQYEKKVAENPILEAHKKAYRRFNSRTRVKKMTQAEFMQWSEEAAQKRDECLAGSLAFDEFVAWLEQGRVRKARSKREDSSK